MLAYLFILQNDGSDDLRKFKTNFYDGYFNDAQVCA